MEGVQVLYQFTRSGVLETILILVSVFSVIGGILLIVAGCLKTGIATLLIFAISICLICLDSVTPPETLYKITINEDYSYSDFSKRYEVIYTEGEILTVTVRE